jgi:hypothetical protein
MGEERKGINSRKLFFGGHTLFRILGLSHVSLSKVVVVVANPLKSKFLLEFVEQQEVE